MIVPSRRLANATLAALVCLSIASSTLARQADLNASVVKDEASSALYSHGSSSDAGRLAAYIDSAEKTTNAGSFVVEHGLNVVKRHKKHHKHKSSSCGGGGKKSSKSSSHTSSSSSQQASTSSSGSSSNNDVASSGSQKAAKPSSNSSKHSSSSSSSQSGNTTLSSPAGSGPYTRVQENRGSGFWNNNNWNFWTYPDPTHGQVNFLDENSLKSKNLIGMKNGAAFMRVSNQDISWGNRDSVRFESKQAFDSGLMIFDVVKMPVGCATWPALWTTKGDSWPTHGEIDVMEGVGYTAGGKNANQMTVHLAQDSPLQLNRRNRKRASYIGEVMQNGQNCNQYVGGGNNAGCAFFDSNKNGPSWGDAFNKAGGGVWAMEFGNGGGVKIWFWGRKSGQMPNELSQGNSSPKKLDTSKWGSPMANFQNGVIDSMVKGQNIIVDITIGGDWAGAVPMDGQCSGQNLQQAIQKGSNYDDAEFIINGIDVYQRGG